jgi:hypothetical protein
LQSVPFVVTAADSSNYNAMTWFTEKPDDALYKAVLAQHEEVKDVLRKIEEHQTENKYV